jgi:hypothetical protein
MPAELRQQMEEAAAAAGRSTNHEIVDRLLKSTQSGSSLPRDLTNVVQAASESLGKTFDETLMFYLVIGMQASNQRQVLEARLQTEEFRGIATRQLLARCAKSLVDTTMYLSRLGFGPREPETEAVLRQEINSTLKDFNDYEIKSVAAKLPRVAEG